MAVVSSKQKYNILHLWHLRSHTWIMRKKLKSVSSHRQTMRRNKDVKNIYTQMKEKWEIKQLYKKKRKNKKHESIVHFTDRVTCSVAEYKDFMIYHRDWPYVSAALSKGFRWPLIWEHNWLQVQPSAVMHVSCWGRGTVWEVKPRLQQQQGTVASV